MKYIILLITSLILIILLCTTIISKENFPEKDFRKSIIKVINIVENHSLRDGHGKETMWVLDDGYPNPIMIFWVDNTVPSWIKKMTPGDKLYISLEKPVDKSYLEMNVSSLNKGLFYTYQVKNNGQLNEDIVGEFTKKYENNTAQIDKDFRGQLEEFFVYEITSKDNKSFCGFRLGIVSEKDPPYKLNTPMYIF